MPDGKMRLIGIMLTRNEDWVIRASLDAALRWCDGMVVLMDRCTDDSPKTAHDMLKVRGKPAVLKRIDTAKVWDEMEMRQQTLVAARDMGGTHFAIIDSDEVLTHNFLPIIRAWFEGLKPGQLLDVPMVPVWEDLDHYRVECPTWSKAWLTLGFRDVPELTWKPAGDGYQHHNRPPHGCIGERLRMSGHGYGGVMHLQFANTRRLLAKHVLYRMVDHLRWPERKSPEQLNWMYDQALKPGGRLEQVPAEWWGDYFKKFIYLDDVPYQELEIMRLIREHGMEKFMGLDLKGWTA